MLTTVAMGDVGAMLNDCRTSSVGGCEISRLMTRSPLERAITNLPHMLGTAQPLTVIAHIARAMFTAMNLDDTHGGAIHLAMTLSNIWKACVTRAQLEFLWI